MSKNPTSKIHPRNPAVSTKYLSNRNDYKKMNENVSGIEAMMVVALVLVALVLSGEIGIIADVAGGIADAAGRVIEVWKRLQSL